MKLPPLRRFYLDDFPEQKLWIGNLISPLNNFIENVIQALDAGLTINENTTSSIVDVYIDRVPSESSPIYVKWSGKVSPRSVIVGNIVKGSETATLTVSSAVFVQWRFTSTKGLQITKLFGVVPSSTDPIYITFNIFGG